MTTSIVKVPKQREQARRLMEISDSQLTIMNANARGVPNGDPLFRVLMRKGDAEALAKFFNRSLTEREYISLADANRAEYLEEHGKDIGAFKDGKPVKAGPSTEGAAAKATEQKPDAPGAGESSGPRIAGEVSQAITRPIGKQERALARVIGDLGRKGWTTHQITTALATCRDMGFADKKLRALAKHGIEPDYVRSFLKAHEDLRTVGWVAAHSHFLFSFEVLAEVFKMVGNDEDKFIDFIEFCGERPQIAEDIHEYMQLGSRGRIRDLRTAISRMLEIYEATFSSSSDIRDLEMIIELGPDEREHWPKITFNQMLEQASEMAATEEMLCHYEIALCESEERLAPDQGNFLPATRRRFGGL
jgi:hypothetical protein